MNGNGQFLWFVGAFALGAGVMWMAQGKRSEATTEAIPQELIDLRERSCAWEAREAFLLDSFSTVHDQQVIELREPQTPAFDEVYHPSPNADSARARFVRHALRVPDRFLLGVDTVR